jgi:hypothetical protein
MCGKTYIMAYLKERIYRSLSEHGIEDDDKFFEEFCKKYNIDPNKQGNMLIYKK